MVTEGQLAIAGYVFKYFNKSRTFMRVLLSICICYGTVYVIERLSWTLSGIGLQLCVRLRVFLSAVPFLHESVVYILTS